MTKLIPAVALLYSTFTFAALVGCSDESKNKPAAQDEADDHGHEHDDHEHEHHEGDGHDHDHDDHDHKDDHKHEDKHSHNHPSQGPHGGHLIELGRDDYHAELVHEDVNGRVSIYLLDAQASKPVAVSSTELLVNLLVDGAPKQLRLAASPLDGEAVGRCSRFQSTDEGLAELLGRTAEISGRLNVTIDGRQFVGTIDHQPHDGHEHEPVREAKIRSELLR